MDPESHLFEQFRSAADADALARVFDATAPELLKLARRLARDRGEAEDLVQATFLAAIVRRASFDETRPLRPWLAGILLREVSLARRARARVPDPARLDSRPSPDPVDEIEASELGEALAIALAKLSPADRAVLLPILYDGKRAVELARELGARPDTVHMRVHRGLARLRRLLPASFALSALASLVRGDSLVCVREQVLANARIELGITGSGAVAVAVAGGIAVKKFLIVASAAVLAASVVLVAQRPREVEQTVATAATERLVLEEEESAEPGTALTSAQTQGEQRSAIAQSDEGPDTTFVELSDAAGAAVQSAHVAFLDADGQVHAADTDASGLCTLPRVGHGIDLYVLRDAALLVRVVVDLSSERTKVLLPEEAEVSGTIELVDGRAPGALELHLASDRTTSDISAADPQVLAALGNPLSEGSSARTRLDAQGGFLFRGLSPDWSGTVRLPPEVWLREEGERDHATDIVLTAPVRDLALRVETRPAIRGRLVDETTGTPLANAEFHAGLRFRDGNETTTGPGSDEHGEFSFLLQERTDVVAVAFGTVRGKDGRRYRVESAVDLDSRINPKDAGDVLCKPIPSRTVILRVIESNERPIPHATVTVKGLMSASTNEEGRAVIPFVPLGDAEIRVAARGYATAILAAESLGDSERIVTLSPTNELVATVEDAKLPFSGSVRISIVAGAPLFGPAEAKVPNRELARVVVGSHEGGSIELAGTRFETYLQPGADGRVVVEEVRTGIPFEVRLLDPFGRVVESVACTPMGLAEKREVALHAAGARRTIAGRVVDTEDRPIDGPHVLYSGPARGFGEPAGADGRFHLAHVLDDAFGVTISKRGYAPVTLPPSAFPADGSELVIRLGRSYDVRILVVDTTGSHVTGARVDASFLGGTPGVDEVTPGEFALRDLPDTELDLTVDVGGRVYKRRHRSTEPIARFELEPHGSVEVSWPETTLASDGLRYQIALRPIDPERHALLEGVPWFPKPGEARFPSVLPGSWTLAIESRGRRTVGSDADSAPMRPPKEIEVRLGETTRITFDP